MITIEQLLESVDLDFEPRFITQDEDGEIWIWNTIPDQNTKSWCLKNGTQKTFRGRFISERLKLSEFDGKDWTECIYEVPRKIDEYEQNLEKLRPADSDLVYRVKLPRKTTGEIEHIKTRKSIDCSDTPEAHIEKHRTFVEIWDKINELVDAVNELKERTEPKKLTGFAKTLSDLDMSKPMSTYTNKGGGEE